MMKPLEWLLALHEQMTDHLFEQDEDDIPGGCKVCWSRLEEVNED